MNIKCSFLKYAKSIGKNDTGNLAANEEILLEYPADLFTKDSVGTKNSKVKSAVFSDFKKDMVQMQL